MKIYTVDAFTNRPFRGNPAAVCPLSKMLPDDTLQDIACEMNLSETAFFVPVDDGYHLRWFTPLQEVDLCGHATLATAHILWQKQYLSEEKIAVFSTLSGTLTAKKQGDWIAMQFPRGETRPITSSISEILQALGIENPVFIGQYRPDRYLIELKNEEQIRQVIPNFSKLKEIGANRIMITAAGNGEPYDFISRYFAPGAGINEDPVTGSAHCYLTPYWAKKTGKNEFSAHQASARGGDLQLKLTDDHVIIRGQAITMLSAALNLI
ncbi:MAG: PhzF family phenazine biosynthesis protein [Anaerolineaceae bacterium]|nr:PhzF family phenazine biosynthesis protein [Anaerolineaceae bacterium]